MKPGIVKLLCVLAATVFASSAMADFKVATYPPVPESWSVKIEGNTVIYESPVSKKQKMPLTKILFTYTKRTENKNAELLTLEYVKKYECKEPKRLGKGFYTASCSDIGRDVVIVGEPNNMYQIEIAGEYNSVALELINSYLNAIVGGKKTFEDRDIGENKS